MPEAAVILRHEGSGCLLITPTDTLTHKSGSGWLLTTPTHTLTHKSGFFLRQNDSTGIYEKSLIIKEMPEAVVILRYEGSG